MMKIRKYISGIILLAIGLWAEKSFAQAVVSAYAVYSPEPEIQKEAWYYMFTKPIIYAAAIPFLLGAGIIFYFQKRKKHEKRNHVK